VFCAELAKTMIFISHLFCIFWRTWHDFCFSSLEIKTAVLKQNFPKAAFKYYNYVYCPNNLKECQ